jgi:hypothetical protein
MGVNLGVSNLEQNTLSEQSVKEKIWSEDGGSNMRVEKIIK